MLKSLRIITTSHPSELQLQRERSLRRLRSLHGLHSEGYSKATVFDSSVKKKKQKLRRKYKRILLKYHKTLTTWIKLNSSKDASKKKSELLAKLKKRLKRLKVRIKRLRKILKIKITVKPVAPVARSQSLSGVVTPTPTPSSPTSGSAPTKSGSVTYTKACYTPTGGITECWLQAPGQPNQPIPD